MMAEQLAVLSIRQQPFNLGEGLSDALFGPLKLRF